MKKIKLLIADDHSVVRKGIITLLEEDENIEIVGEAADGFEAIDQIKKLKPDVILLDITMPNLSGIETAKLVSTKHPQTKTLIFSMHNNQEYMLRSVENGALGYLLKDSPKEEIMSAIQSVSMGKKYFPPDVSVQIIEGLLSERKSTNSTNPLNSILTKQEKMILNYIIEGMSSQEIATKFSLSVRTVSNHRANILRKAKVKNTAELVRIAINN